MAVSLSSRKGEIMRHLVAVMAIAVLAALSLAGTAGADPTRSTKAVVFHANCTGLGEVQLVNTEPAHTEALQVVGSNTVVLVPFNGAPGIIRAGTAAGTTCTFADGPPGFPATVPVVNINA
jgi:hypothetical protein